jgi:CRISPR-associated protein Cas6
MPFGQNSLINKMYWQEDKQDDNYVVPDDVVDVMFNIVCRALPVDHAFALSEALIAESPWLAEEERAGMHHIHIPEAANGWMRPEDGAELMYLSRRTRLIIRVPRHRIEDVQGLSGCTLLVSGMSMEIGESTIRQLSDMTTLVSRHMVSDKGDNEEAFMENMAALLSDMGIRPKKMLPGKSNVIQTPEEKIETRSLMLAELSPEESVKLQQEGLGPYRHLGCGLFIPQKDIKELKDPGDA